MVAIVDHCLLFVLIEEIDTWTFCNVRLAISYARIHFCFYCHSVNSDSHYLLPELIQHFVISLWDYVLSLVHLLPI